MKKSILLLCCFASAYAVDPCLEKNIIEKRIAPVGVVNTAPAQPAAQGAPAATPAPAAAPTPAATEAAKPAAPTAEQGKATYDRYCTLCHDAGVAGAPKRGNEADWAPRLAKGKAVLLQHAIAGFNVMPPKGTCLSCTSDELKAAIEYMLPKAAQGDHP